MQILYLRRVLPVFLIPRDRIHRARSEERNARYDLLELLWLQALHEVRHARRFKLEHALGISLADHLEYGRVVVFHLRKIYVYAMPLMYEGQRVSYRFDVPQTEEVHLEKAQLLQSVLLELCFYDLAVAVERNVFSDALLRNDDSGGVRGCVPRHTLEGPCHIDHAPRVLIVLVRSGELLVHLESSVYRDTKDVWYRFRYPVRLGVAYSQNAADVPDGGPGLERTERYDLSDVLGAVFCYDVVDDLAPPVVGEVDIYIRHADPFGVQEPLEDQAVFDRVDVCYIQRVSDYAACGRSSSGADHDAMALRVVDVVPYYQEVVHEAHLLDDGKLRFESFAELFAYFAVLSEHAFFAQLS